MARCLVLGSTGFIGSHLVDYLAEQGHFVRCFGRYKSTDTNSFENKEHHDIEIYRGDFLSKSSLDAALDDIEYVFHLISTTTPISSDADPLVDVDTNIRMSVQLFDLCVKKGVKRVIFASSGGAIYGNVDTLDSLSEDTCPNPISPYAIGKLTIENYLRYFRVKHGLDSFSLRISNPYGPRQNILSGQGVIGVFLDKVASGKPITVFGDGTMVRDYIYIEDVVKMIAGASMQEKHDFDVYNIGSGIGYSINDLLKSIKEVTGAEMQVEHVKAPTTFVQHVKLDSTRFVREFDISPSIDLNEGIKRTWQDRQLNNR